MYVWLYLGVTVGLDAHVETRPVRSGGRRVGPQVDNDGSGRVEPLQRPLWAAEVDLLHVSAVRLVAQAAADRVQGLKTITCFKKKKTKLYHVQTNIWKRFNDPAVVKEPNLVQLSANKSLTQDRCSRFVFDVPP